jgi:hypothetical protein
MPMSRLSKNTTEITAKFAENAEQKNFLIFSERSAVSAVKYISKAISNEIYAGQQNEKRLDA